jgi:glycerol-3-phosphate dehydrogenase
MASPFSAETREATLAALPAADLDLLVIGGGITGAGVARDAALRGLRVALVERTDWAAGTSSRSSKLIHGGVRYLEQGELALVREAASERTVLRSLAPHLAEPVLMVMPTYRRTTHAKLVLGLFAYDRIASVPAAERHAVWAREEALGEEPTLARDGLHGAVVFTEYLTDDARLVLANVRSAHAAGALCANHAEVTGITPDAARTELAITDRLSGTTRTARARVVVNAAGPWVDAVRGLAGALGGQRLHLTKGIHLVVPHARLPLRRVVVMPARDKRSVFAIPRDGITYLGTTDTDYGAPADHPEVTGEDADYLLDAANGVFTGPPLRRSDVIGAWAGLRPLLHEEGKRPSEISRKDEIMAAPDGLISIAGGKLTAYRRMAERVTDLVCERLGRGGPCRTGTLPLPDGELTPAALARLPEVLRSRLPALPPGGAERLVRLHGAGVTRLLARIEGDGAGEPLPGTSGLLRAEIEMALDEEMALTLEDVLERRTRLLLFGARQGLDAVEPVAALAAARLGWNDERRTREIAGYRALAESLRRFA